MHLCALCQAKINLYLWRDNHGKWKYSTLSGKKEDLAQLCESLGLFVRFGELSLELSLHMH